MRQEGVAWYSTMYCINLHIWTIFYFQCVVMGGWRCCFCLFCGICCLSVDGKQY